MNRKTTMVKKLNKSQLIKLAKKIKLKFLKSGCSIEKFFDWGGYELIETKIITKSYDVDKISSKEDDLRMMQTNHIKTLIQTGKV